MITLETVPRPVDNFITRQIDEETILLSEEGDHLHTLDEVGTFIWKAIDGNRSLENILEMVCSEYEVTPEVAAKDLLRFIHELSETGIISVEQVHKLATDIQTYTDDDQEPGKMG